MNYQESLNYLENLQKFGIKPGLLRIKELVRRLGNPHLSESKFVHVAGTNGKGSVSALLSSVCVAEGYVTGFFSSPHLHCYRERYRLNNCLISKKELASLVSEIKEQVEAMVSEGWESPTEFEVSTALALLYFARRQAQVVIMECGLGGDLDSTNIIRAQLALITNVSLDHCQYLGKTIKEVAKAKAGIIKPQAQVITAACGEALEVIKQSAGEKGAQLLVLDEDFSYRRQSDFAKEGQIFSLKTPQKTYQQLKLPLLGEHQLKNAALAVMAAEKLGIGEAAVKSGLAAVKWPGRLEILSKEPLVVLDGAHNADGMKALSQALAEYWPKRRVIAVLGMLADKERQEALAHLLPRVERAIISCPANERAGNWQYLAEIAHKYNVETELYADIDAACKRGLSLVCQEGCQEKHQEIKPLLLVTGSLFLLPQAINTLKAELDYKIF
ncbi:MAG: bifunctional folylpolyglutamate synthase/dihydrofolate synthase [Bacillota bacterium]|jgi:dihydrofolate synthase/folylpolyglutamate synthase